MNSKTFSFFKFPRALIELPEFSSLSSDAKILFALILDRVDLSEKNAERFTDANGKIYVIYTVREICRKLGCSHTTAVKITDELEIYGLIRKQHTGQGKANRILLTPDVLSVLNFGTPDSKNLNSAIQENGIQEFQNLESIYTDNNYTDISYTDSTINYDRAVEEIEEQIEADLIDKDADVVKEIVMIMADVMCGTSPSVKISGEDVPREVVVSHYRKLNSEHITFVIDCLEDSPKRIRNVKSYLTSALFNAPVTMASSVTAQYNYNVRNIGQGKITDDAV